MAQISPLLAISPANSCQFPIYSSISHMLFLARHGLQSLRRLRLGQVVLALRSGTGPLCQASMAEAETSDERIVLQKVEFSPTRRTGPPNKWLGLSWIELVHVQDINFGLRMKWAGGNCPQSSWHCSLGSPGTTKGWECFGIEWSTALETEHFGGRSTGWSFLWHFAGYFMRISLCSFWICVYAPTVTN